VTLTGTDAVLLVCLGLLVLIGWWLIITGPDVAETPIYALMAAGAVQVALHPGTLSRASIGLLIAGLLLALVSLGIYELTRRQLSTFLAAGRFPEVNWRTLAALSLWITGAGCVITAVHPLFGFSLAAGVVAWVCWVLPRPARVIRTHVTIEIRCEPSAAFDVVGDPRRMGSYIDGLEVEAPANREVGVGYRYHSRFRSKGGYVFEDDQEVVEYHPGRLIKSKVLGRPDTGTSSVELAPAGTRVIHDFESVVSPEQALLGLRRKVIRRAIDLRKDAYKRLRELLEAPPGSPSTQPPV
jgi:hypothetical protein